MGPLVTAATSEGNPYPNPTALSIGERINEVVSSMEVAPISRETGCVFGDRNPGVPAARRA